ncbi:SNF2 family N-terminal domain-containing protein [Geopyxis carbonaria]|nr:SNF2 family N-terminal domain-containing protein [Geopyxis carbonaria]
MGSYATHPNVTTSGNNNPIIDLTDDDDDVIITGENICTEVCFGMLRENFIKGHHVPWPKPGTDNDSNNWPVIPLKLERSSNRSTFIVLVRDPADQLFGCVEIGNAQVLAPLMDLGITRLEARMYPRQKMVQTPGAPLCAPYKFFVVIYGQENVAQQLGNFLAQKSRFLEKPYHEQMANLPYRNPHEGRIIKDPSVVVRTNDETRQDFNKVFDGLDQAETLPEMEADPRIKTPLISHQKQGLYFLTSKEKIRTYDDNETTNSTLWRWHKGHGGPGFYRHLITSQETSTRPPDVRGGILADMMGLGKTLQILSLVVSTQNEAIEFPKTFKVPESSTMREMEPDLPKRVAKTTLLISPLTTIANWEDQIRAHVQEGAIKYYIYHGTKRIQDAAVLAEYDLVITTYQVIASEYSKHLKDKSTFTGPLQQLYFFRIVLDEAHMIREQSTLQSKAVISLHAERRWAVTGTPVQNRLDDIAALIKFLRMKPFDEKSIFNQYITNPFRNAETESIKVLRMLVDSITLRRLKDRINIPKRFDQDVFLKFSPEEQDLYNATQKQTALRAKVIMDVGAKFHHVLRLILRLRQLCAHGRQLLGVDDLEAIAGLTPTDAINVEQLGEVSSTLSSREAYETFDLLTQTNADFCSFCNTKVEKDSSTSPIGYITACSHILCRGCLRNYTDSISPNFVLGSQATCSLCDYHGVIFPFELTSEGLNKFEQKTVKNITQRDGFRYLGPSPKVKKLLEYLMENREESTVDGRIKSVVFSCWTSHMDLIELAFKEVGVRWVRLDGRLSRAQRNEVMQKFRENMDIEVMLISLAAGGLGLNLTAACRAYVMEPQFNPAAEAQAIDRIHRLGQTREVKCIRFIMEDSFELKILELQKKKNDLANMTMAGGKKLSRKEFSKKRLEVCPALLF